MIHDTRQIQLEYPKAKCLSNCAYKHQNAELKHWKQMLNYKNGKKGVIKDSKIIIKPTKNNIIAVKPLHPTKLNIVRIFDIKATEEMLSSRKKTPVSAINHKRLTFGTINKRIPRVNINAPKKIDQIILEM